MPVVMAIIGAVVGYGLASGYHELFGLAFGAVAGFVLYELNSQNARLQELAEELSALRRLISRQRPNVQQEGERPPETGPPTASLERQPAQSGEPIPTQRATRSDIPSSVRSDDLRRPSAAAASTSARPGTQDTRAAGVDVGHDFGSSRGRPSVGAVDTGGIADAAVRLIRDYFTGGNTLVRVGILILFFGVAFLLRYAAEHSHVPIEWRLSGVSLAGLALLVLGWRLRKKRTGYALALQGGGVGILYLTVFAALRIYAVLPLGAAFALLVIVAALSAALAVLQNSQAFALLGVTGGFLAPVLASSGHGSHVVLFSYYAILNAGILAVAWFKAWRALNVVGFLFTFVIGTAWGALSYEPRLFASTEPFLVLFFLFYVAIAVLFASRQVPELRGYVDGTLVFGTPLVAFGLQSGMLHSQPFALAYSALAVSALYLLLARWLHGWRRPTYRLLIEAFLGLGVLFLTLAVPLALDGRWSAATWALEGALLVWIGCRQERRLPRIFGALLQFAGGIIFWLDLDFQYGRLPVINSACLGGAMVAAASVFSASRLQRHQDRLQPYEQALAPILFFWGLLWWLYSGLTEIQRRVPDRFDATCGLLYVTATALLSGELHRRAQLTWARLPALWLLPAMVLYALLAVFEVHHPFADGGWVAWPVAFAGFYWLCRQHEGAAESWGARCLHAGGSWLLLALGGWEFAWTVDQAVAGAGSWPAIAWALVPATALFLLPRLIARFAWPFGVHQDTYTYIVGAGAALYLALWSVVTNVLLPGDPYPIRFVPLLNPLDLAQAYTLMVLVRYQLFARSHAGSARAGLSDAMSFGVLASLAFLWLNAALLRTLHHWAHVPYLLADMIRSTLVETALSVFWAALALTTMLVATRRSSRRVWMTGAGLLGVVIAKLFLVDLSHIGTIERIVSFVGVGLLMLVVGYYSPLPPAKALADLPTDSPQSTVSE